MAHTVSLVHIFPRIRPSHYIFHLLPLHLFPLIVFLIDQELVGASTAFQAILSGGEFDGVVATARDGEAV